MLKSLSGKGECVMAVNNKKAKGEAIMMTKYKQFIEDEVACTVEE